ncbi:MAG: restriction endonuclease subunit S [Ignavibacteriales bacterium]|nr:restriction endonuclease subunit S [Ignavibacteriales bacterium]
MKLKEGYRQTEVGIIPNDWEIKRLGDLGSFKKGKGINKDNVISDGLPCIRYGEIYTHHNEYIKKFNSFINYETARDSQKISQGDLLFAGSGETAEEIGKCVAFLDNIEAYAGGDIIILSPKDYDSKFLCFLLNNNIVTKQKTQLGQGDAVVHIYSRNLRSILIPLPPTKEEQTTIAQALSDTDELINSLDGLIAKKRNIKQGAMQQLLTGKKRLPGFRGEWKIVLFQELADKTIKWSFTGGPFGSNLKTTHYTNEGIRIIQLQNIGDGCFIDDYKIYTSIQKANELISCNIYPGELILSKMGDPVARACIIPSNEKRYLMSSDGIRLAVDKNRFSKVFIYYYLNFRAFRTIVDSASTGSTRKRIGLNDLKTLPLILPFLHEQIAISQILCDMDSEIESLEKKRDKYKAIKQGIMQELLTGRIRLV